MKLRQVCFAILESIVWQSSFEDESCSEEEDEGQDKKIA